MSEKEKLKKNLKKTTVIGRQYIFASDGISTSLLETCGLCQFIGLQNGQAAF